MSFSVLLFSDFGQIHIKLFQKLRGSDSLVCFVFVFFFCLFVVFFFFFFFFFFSDLDLGIASTDDK